MLLPSFLDTNFSGIDRFLGILGNHPGAAETQNTLDTAILAEFLYPAFGDIPKRSSISD